MKIQEINVYTVLKLENKVLLLKTKQGFWEFPGGSIDWGEKPIDAAKRETLEETGIEVEDLTFIGVTSCTYKKDQNDKHSIYLVYLKELEKIYKEVISKEHVDSRWEEIKNINKKNLGLNARPILDFHPLLVD